jgi:hypothetical protein
MGNFSVATCDIISTVPRTSDRAVVMATALQQIFGSTAPAQERLAAATAYVREELDDAAHQIAADRGLGEGFHALPDFFGPPTSAGPFLGLAVRPPNACRRCGDPVAIVGPGTPPHYASLHCRSCGRHHGWLSRANCTFLTKVINNGGAPREPIVLRTPLQNRRPSDDGISVVHHTDMKKD